MKQHLAIYQQRSDGGYDNPQGAGFGFDTRPTPDGTGWRVFISNFSTTAGASGSVYAVCLR